MPVFAGVSSPPVHEPAETRATTAQGKSSQKSSQSLLLSENVRSIGGPPALLEGLSFSERETVLKQARRRVFYRGQTLFNQDTPHEGIYLIESGRIRVFYNAPSGREITLAYWYPGNFVGGPDIFGTSAHVWSGVATTDSSVLHLPGKALRNLAMQIPAFGIGLIEGLAFKGSAIPPSCRCSVPGRLPNGSPSCCCIWSMPTGSMSPTESSSQRRLHTPNSPTWSAPLGNG